MNSNDNKDNLEKFKEKESHAHQYPCTHNSKLGNETTGVSVRNSTLPISESQQQEETTIRIGEPINEKKGISEFEMIEDEKEFVEVDTDSTGSVKTFSISDNASSQVLDGSEVLETNDQHAQLSTYYFGSLGDGFIQDEPSNSGLTQGEKEIFFNSEHYTLQERKD